MSTRLENQKVFEWILNPIDIVARCFCFVLQNFSLSAEDGRRSTGQVSTLIKVARSTGSKRRTFQWKFHKKTGQKWSLKWVIWQSYRVTPKTTQLSSFRILLTVSNIWILLRWVEIEKIKQKNFSSQMYSRIMRIHVKKSHSVNYFCWDQWVVIEFWG